MVFQAKSKDLAVVCDLAVKIWGGNFEMMEQEFSPRLNNKNIAILVVEDEGKPAGFIECFLDGENGEKIGRMEGVYVLPQCRGKGLAKTLFDSAVDYFKKRGVERLESGCPYCKKQLLLLDKTKIEEK